MSAGFSRPQHPAEGRCRSLLAEVRDVLYSDAEDLIEGCSLLERVGDDFVPREGTLDPEASADAERLLDLIRRIEEQVDDERYPATEQPAWPVDLVHQRRRL